MATEHTVVRSGKSKRKPFKLDQIRAPDDGIFMDTIQVRFVPETSPL